jgi:hypothetical protein
VMNPALYSSENIPSSNKVLMSLMFMELNG